MHGPDKSTLHRQLAKYESAIAEFMAIDAELQRQPQSARVADMIRINRDTISSMQRSIEMIRERIEHNGNGSRPPI